MKKYLYALIILLILGASFFGVKKYIASRGAKSIATSPNGESLPKQNTKSFFGIFNFGNSPNANNNTAPAAEPQSAAAPADSNSFSFAILGDSRHFGNNPQGGLELAVGQIKKQNIAFAISEGDLIPGCDGGSKCLAKYTNWKNILGPLMAKTYAVNGNHDCTTPEDATIWNQVFNFPTNGPTDHKKLAYSWNVGNSHFVVMDTENPSQHKVDSQQRQWLDQDLSASKQENIFVFYHEPAFASSIEVADSLDAKPDDRDALWQIIDKHHVTAVFNGHEHLYSRRKINSSVFPGAKNQIEQFVVGDTDVNDPDTPKAGQSDFSYNAGKAFAIVTVNGKNINLKLFTVDGKQVDSFDFT